MDKNSFVGAWKMVSFIVERDGEISYPRGKDAVGYIIYSQDGFMSAVIMPANRPRFAADTLAGGSDQEKAAATDSYMSYCGRYEIRGNTVIHHVEASLFPNWIGTDLERAVEFDGDRIVLSPPPRIVDGVKQSSHLTWERI